MATADLVKITLTETSRKERESQDSKQEEKREI
jgi:hypothetical protein